MCCWLRTVCADCRDGSGQSFAVLCLPSPSMACSCVTTNDCVATSRKLANGCRPCLPPSLRRLRLSVSCCLSLQTAPTRRAAAPLPSYLPSELQRWSAGVVANPHSPEQQQFRWHHECVCFRSFEILMLHKQPRRKSFEFVVYTER